MRTGEQSGAACGGQAEVWVSVLVHASCLPVHFHLCIPTRVYLQLHLYVLLVCTCRVYACVFTSAYIVFLHKHIQNGLLYGVLAGLGVPFYSQASHLYLQHPRSCCTHMTFGM